MGKPSDKKKGGNGAGQEGGRQKKLVAGFTTAGKKSLIGASGRQSAIPLERINRAPLRIADEGDSHQCTRTVF